MGDKDLFGNPVARSRERPENAAEVDAIWDAMATGEPMREIMEMFYRLHGDAYGLCPPVTALRRARQDAIGGMRRG